MSQKWSHDDQSALLPCRWDDECDNFSTSRPIRTGEGWLSVSEADSETDATVKDALTEAFYAYYEMNPRPDED